MPLPEAGLRWPNDSRRREGDRGRPRHHGGKRGRAVRHRHSLAGREERADAPPNKDSYRARAPPNERPPADETSSPSDTWLGIRPFELTPNWPKPIPARRPRSRSDLCPRRPGPPGPAPAPLQSGAAGERGAAALDSHRQQGDQLRRAPRRRRAVGARAVAANYERKAHRLVDIDIILVANGPQCLRRCSTRRCTGYGSWRFDLRLIRSAPRAPSDP